MLNGLAVNGERAGEPGSPRKGDAAEGAAGAGAALAPRAAPPLWPL